MKNLKMFCTTLEPNHYKFIKKLGYIPVGLGENFFSGDWFRDNSGQNISKKNKIMPNVLITTGFGKIFWINMMVNGSDFVITGNFGV